MCTDDLSHAVGPPALLQATTPCLWKLSTRSGGPGGRLSGILTAFWHSTLPPVLCCSALSEKGLLKRGICEHQEGRTGQESTLGDIETFLSNSFDRKSLFFFAILKQQCFLCRVCCSRICGDSAKVETVWTELRTSQEASLYFTWELALWFWTVLLLNFLVDSIFKRCCFMLILYFGYLTLVAKAVCTPSIWREGRLKLWRRLWRGDGKCRLLQSGIGKTGRQNTQGGRSKMAGKRVTS